MTPPCGQTPLNAPGGRTAERHLPTGGVGYVVCGSRDWPAPWFVTAKIVEHVPPGSVIITGGARGVDRHAHAVALELGYPTRVVLADWQRHGKRAGLLRNIAMLATHPAAVIAFHYRGSKGAAHTIREAQRRGIPVHLYTEDSLRSPDAALATELEASGRAGTEGGAMTAALHQGLSDHDRSGAQEGARPGGTARVGGLDVRRGSGAPSGPRA